MGTIITLQEESRFQVCVKSFKFKFYPIFCVFEHECVHSIFDTFQRVY